MISRIRETRINSRLKRDRIGLDCYHDGSTPPLPLAGRAIAYADIFHRHARHNSSCPGLSRASTFFVPLERSWMAGTSPAMTMWKRLHEKRAAVICDSPALAGEGWGGGGAAKNTPSVEKAPTRRFAIAEAQLRRPHLRTAAGGGLCLPRKRERLSEPAAQPIQPKAIPL